MRTREKLFFLVKIKPVPFILYGIIILLWNCLVILSALCLQALFDTFGEMNHVSHNIYASVILLVLVYVLRGVTSYIVVGLSSWGGFSIDAFLKTNVIERIFDAYGAKFPSIAQGEILNIFRDDIAQIKNFLLQLTELVALSVYFFIMLVVLIQINTIILLAILMVAFASVFFIRLGYKKLGQYQKEMREMDALVTSFSGEVLNGILAIKIADKKQSILEHFKKLGDKREKASVRENVLRQFLNSLNSFFYVFGEGLILLLAFQMIREGRFSIGDFAIFTFLFDGISTVISSTAMVITAIPQTGIAINRLENLIISHVVDSKIASKSVMEIYKKKESVLDDIMKLEEPLQELELRNLGVQLGNGIQILKNVTFTMKRGTITIVAGKTATGKSLLLRGILGLYPTNEGNIFWNGIEVENPKEFFVPPVSSYTPQSPKFFVGSIRDNILLGKRQEEEILNVDVIEEIGLSVLEEDVKEMEHGVDTIIGRKGSKVSGGQAKRIALSRMYAKEAEIYVVDDVSSALDIETEQKIWNKMKRCVDKTFLIASNSIFAMKIADQIVYLEDGMAEIYGSLEEALSKSSNIREMVAK